MAAGRPVEWFEDLYQEAARGHAVIPWADLIPNPHLVSWLDGAGQGLARGRALDVGTGLGDNAAELSRRGLEVTAFDVSRTAVEAAERRFPGFAITWRAADVLSPPNEWKGSFDLIFEAYTLQVLPPAERRRAEASLRSLLAPGGLLLVVARGREPEDPPGTFPWPLTVAEVRAIAGDSLELATFEDFLDQEEPPVRRLRATFRAPRP